MLVELLVLLLLPLLVPILTRNAAGPGGHRPLMDIYIELFPATTERLTSNGAIDDLLTARTSLVLHINHAQKKIES